MTGSGPGERQLEIDGFRINVREAGDGTAVVLLNGLGANVGMLAGLQDRLRGHRSIAIDAPGAGASTTPALPLSFSELAQLMARLLGELGHEQVDLIGYSYGGGVAQQLARDHPGLVRRVVLAATSCGFGGVPGDPLALGSLLTPLRYYSPWVHAQTWGWTGVGRATLDAVTVEADRKARRAAPPSPVGYLWQVLAGISWTSWAWLPQIEQPVLVITGEQDRLVPATNSVLLAGRLPNARLMLVPDEDHHIFTRPTPELVEAILEFLDSPTLEQSDTWNAATEVAEPYPDQDCLANRYAAWAALTNWWRPMFSRV